MVNVAGASYNDPSQGTRGGSIILPSRFLSILNYFSIIFCDRTHKTTKKLDLDLLGLLNKSKIPGNCGFPLANLHSVESVDVVPKSNPLN